MAAAEPSALPQGMQLPDHLFGGAPAPSSPPSAPPLCDQIVLPQDVFECYFLLGVSGEWLRLWPHCRYTVGSSPACELILDDPEISSRHALIEFHTGSFHLCDLSSATGTFVDDLPIYDHSLAHGDCIRFGARVFRFLAGEEMTLINELMAAQGDKAFSGNLDDTPLMDVLQFLHSTRKSGALSLVQNRGMGVVEFLGGAIIYAELGEFTGAEAIYRLLALRSGRFVFSNNTGGSRVFRRNVSESTPFLIIEAARRMDESKPSA